MNYRGLMGLVWNIDIGWRNGSKLVTPCDPSKKGLFQILKRPAICDRQDLEAVCPLMIYGEIVQRWRIADGAVMQKWPQSVEKYGAWFLYVLFFGILMWEETIWAAKMRCFSRLAYSKIPKPSNLDELCMILRASSPCLLVMSRISENSLIPFEQGRAWCCQKSLIGLICFSVVSCVCLFPLKMYWSLSLLGFPISSPFCFVFFSCACMSFRFPCSLFSSFMIFYASLICQGVCRFCVSSFSSSPCPHLLCKLVSLCHLGRTTLPWKLMWTLRFHGQFCSVPCLKHRFRFLPFPITQTVQFDFQCFSSRSSFRFGSGSSWFSVYISHCIFLYSSINYKL